MTREQLREAYYEIRLRNERLRIDHSILFEACEWHEAGETQCRIGQRGYKLVVGQTEEGIAAVVFDPKGKQIACYR